MFVMVISIRKFQSVYIVLIAVNLFMFFLQNIIGNSLTSNFMLVPSDVLARPWIMFTSMFLHGSFWHLFFNIYVLFIFGGLIEERIGSKRFLGIYIFGGLFASFVYSLFPPINPVTGLGIPALGASGAIMAILGLVIMLLPNLQVLFFFIIPMSMRTAGIIFAAIDIFGLFNPSSGIAHLAHLGGLAVGLIIGYFLMKRREKFIKKFNSNSPVKKKSSVKNYFGKKDTIEMSDEDIEEYIRNGRL